MRVVGRFNCTPTEAISELRHNPWIYDLLAVDLYEEAYYAVKKWDAMDPKSRERVPAPSGLWVDRVRANAAKIIKEQFDARDAARTRAGMA